MRSADEYCIFDIPTKPPYGYPNRPTPNPYSPKKKSFFLLQDKNNTECGKKNVFANDLSTKNNEPAGNQRLVIAQTSLFQHTDTQLCPFDTILTKTVSTILQLISAKSKHTIPKT